VVAGVVVFFAVQPESCDALLVPLKVWVVRVGVIAGVVAARPRRRRSHVVVVDADDVFSL